MKEEEIELLNNNRKAKQWNKDTETWMAHAASMHVPIDGTFELTARCNLRCKMCYVRMQKDQTELMGGELSAKQWIELGREAFEAGTLYLLITGGEPLLHPAFEEIYTALSQMGFYLTLFTNATLIDEKILSLFKKYPPAHIQVTLYGASRETYEKVCGNKDAFDKTIHGLTLLKQVSTKLGIRTTFIKENADDLKALYDLASQYSNEYRINPEVHKAFDCTDSDVEACRLTPDEALSLEDEFKKYLLAKTRSKVYNNSEEYIYDERKLRTGFELEPVILECLAAKASYSVNWQGKMFACNTFSTLYTEPLKEGLLSAFRRLPEVLSVLKKPKECEQCELDQLHACPNCPPKLYVETGSFEKTCSYICDYAKKRHNSYLRKENGYDERI